ncbi:hypothetical protein HPB50_010754 [Hyalomma asiaticum]|uniref:Uncharacterized protein n=1 Tax=Hyalomma asiaticum TaxID=266040 RepID=A0ACB7T935_HYAAI|nr:hypothetical protein HPB50_010754 [Hyalomma asiaticum]
MIVRLPHNLDVDGLAQKLTEAGEPGDIRALHLTNCVLLNSKQVVSLIHACTHLRSLRCLSCALKPSDLLELMLEQLPFLVELVFTLECQTDSTKELQCMHKVESRNRTGAFIGSLRRMYVEIRYDPSFLILSSFVRLCLMLHYLHVHLARGNFRTARRRCRVIFQNHTRLKWFTFTSDVPALPVSHCSQLTRQLDFTSGVSICANVTYCKSLGPHSYAWLHELAAVRNEPCRLPRQLTVVTTDSPEVISEEWFRVVGFRCEWAKVRHLCLVLIPQQACVDAYATAGSKYRENLRFFFCTALWHVVELNMSSFHFDDDLDLAHLLQDKCLRTLRSLSASPCGLRRPLALQRLAECCPELRDLDVRFERNGSFVSCTSCEAELAPLKELELLAMRSDGSVSFRNPLASLTFSGVPFAACVWFIEKCGATTRIQLSDYSSPSRQGLALFCTLLPNIIAPTWLILRHEKLQLDDAFLLVCLTRVHSLQYLYLLSAVPLVDDAAWTCVQMLSYGLPRLLCVHVHYRSPADVNGIDKRITWLRKGGSEPHLGVFLRDAPCFGSCSTATFIGLYKPLNRDFSLNC